MAPGPGPAPAQRRQGITKGPVRVAAQRHRCEERCRGERSCRRRRRSCRGGEHCNATRRRRRRSRRLRQSRRPGRQRRQRERRGAARPTARRRMVLGRGPPRPPPARCAGAPAATSAPAGTSAPCTPSELTAEQGPPPPQLQRCRCRSIGRPWPVPERWPPLALTVAASSYALTSWPWRASRSSSSTRTRLPTTGRVTAAALCTTTLAWRRTLCAPSATRARCQLVTGSSQ
mmetsp:Transcript_46465/g.124182  ORF Transcript_46465/g.124182 Transcript_46465/m.124182 type:complete len:231 (+) Transcript_46465:1929-2621(+)